MLSLKQGMQLKKDLEKLKGTMPTLDSVDVQEKKKKEGNLPSGNTTNEDEKKNRIAFSKMEEKDRYEFFLKEFKDDNEVWVFTTLCIPFSSLSDISRIGKDGPPKSPHSKNLVGKVIVIRTETGFFFEG